MPFKPPKKQPQFADLKGILAQSKDTDNALYQTVQAIIERLTQFQTVVVEQIVIAGDPTNPNSNLATKFATYHTKQDDSSVLPNSVQLLSGVGIEFDDTILNKRTISHTLYRDLVEGVPANPPADNARLYALDVNGYTQVEMKDSVGHGVRLASDNVLIAKIAEPTGVTRGQAVYISGASGANALVRLARANNIATMPAIGLVMDTAANNAFTRIILSGTFQGISTSVFAEGASLFVSPDFSGSLISSLPVYPNYAQRVGFVTRSHGTQGEILVMTTGTVTDPRLHAPSHSAGGTDPVAVTALAGFPGNVTTFLRADGTFATPASGAIAPHAPTHNTGGSDPITALSGGVITTGTVADARLSPNVALKNINNFFVAQTLADGSEVQGNYGYFAFRSNPAGVDQKLWRMLQYGDGMFRLEALNDSASTVLVDFYFRRDGTFQAQKIQATNLFYGPNYQFPPASAANRTLDPNTLDDYQEQFFLPIISGDSGTGVTYGFRNGLCIKIGGMVHITGGLNLSSKGTSAGQVYLSGFPWPCSNNANSGGIISYFSGLLTSVTQLTVVMPPTAPYGVLHYVPAAGANITSPLTFASVSNNLDIRFHVSYPVQGI